MGSSDKDQEQKQIPEVQTFSVPYALDETNEKITISTNFLINSAGLFAESNAKQIEAYPKKLIPKTSFVKGNYFSEKEKLAPGKMKCPMKLLKK